MEAMAESEVVTVFDEVCGFLNIRELCTPAQLDQILQKFTGERLNVQFWNNGFSVKGSLTQLVDFGQQVRQASESTRICGEFEDEALSLLHEILNGKRKQEESTPQNVSRTLQNKTYDIVYLLFILANNYKEIRRKARNVSIHRKPTSGKEEIQTIKIGFNGEKDNTMKLVNLIDRLYEQEKEIPYVWKPISGSPAFKAHVIHCCCEKFQPELLVLDKEILYAVVSKRNKRKCEEWMEEITTKDTGVETTYHGEIRDVLMKYASGKMKSHSPEATLRERGDPSGEKVEEALEGTSLEVLRKKGKHRHRTSTSTYETIKGTSSGGSGGSGEEDEGASEGSSHGELSNKDTHRDRTSNSIRETTKGASEGYNDAEMDFGQYNDTVKPTNKPQIEKLMLDVDTLKYIEQFSGGEVKSLEDKHYVRLDFSEQSEGVILVMNLSRQPFSPNVIPDIGEKLQTIFYDLISHVIDISNKGIAVKEHMGRISKICRNRQILLDTTRPNIIQLFGYNEDVSQVASEIEGLIWPTQRRQRKLVRSSSQNSPDTSEALPIVHNYFATMNPVGAVPSPNVERRAYQHNKTKLQIHTSVGDITELKVGAIVNAANRDLIHVGGVAKAIAKAGGHTIDKESNEYIRKHRYLDIGKVCVTSAGRLPCKKVFHVVGPQFSDYKDDKQLIDVLRDVFSIVIKKAAEQKLESIAIPSVSSGIYGVPQYIVAECVTDSIDMYLRKTKSTTLKVIHLIDIQPQMIGVIQKQMDQLVEKGEFTVYTAKPDAAYGAIPKVKAEKSPKSPPSPKQSPKSKDKVKPAAAASAASSPTPRNQMTNQVEAAEDCCICMCEITKPKTLPCKHTFCKECIDRGFKVKPACPICGAIYGKITGNQPKNGSMSHSVQNSIRLPGYESCGAIIISYSFAGGTQTKEHEHPGKPYSGTSRIAYLPDNTEGRHVHKLLKEAFAARLVFTVGSSRTSGRTDTVTWNDIHHKTNTVGGPQSFGYPDPTYLKRVKEELAAKGIK